MLAEKKMEKLLHNIWSDVYDIVWDLREDDNITKAALGLGKVLNYIEMECSKDNDSRLKAIDKMKKVLFELAMNDSVTLVALLKALDIYQADYKAALKERKEALIAKINRLDGELDLLVKMEEEE